MASRSEKNIFWFLQNMTFYLYIVIYLFIHSVYIYICSICIYDYMCIYIYVCVYVYIYMCVNLCLFFKKIHTYIYIYKCVCGGGCLKMKCPFFLSKNPFWNQKKTPRFETYPCIYNIYLLTCVFCFYPVLVCPIQKICFLVFFCM